MRDCKIWLRLSHNDGDRPCSVSSQVLQNIIKKEMRAVLTLEDPTPWRV